MGQHARVEGMDRLRRRMAQVQAAVSDESRLARFLDAIAQTGADVAQARFNAAAYPGAKDVAVSVVRDSETRYRVVASGTSVLFVEFGSGVTYPATNPRADDLGFVPRSWSSTHANAIKRDGLWVYYGQPGGDATPVSGRPSNTWWTQGNPSANAMYEAAKDMRGTIARAWRAAFRSGA